MPSFTTVLHRRIRSHPAADQLMAWCNLREILRELLPVAKNKNPPSLSLNQLSVRWPDLWDENRGHFPTFYMETENIPISTRNIIKTSHVLATKIGDKVVFLVFFRGQTTKIGDRARKWRFTLLSMTEMWMVNRLPISNTRQGFRRL